MKNLKTARNNKGFTQDKLAKMLGASRSSISMWEAGINQPDNDVLLRLADILGVTVDYLLGRTESGADDNRSYDNILPFKTKKVPLLGDIACGTPIFADEQFGEFVDVADDLKADFCLRAKGDSMIGARIHDGDIVFCESVEEVENGQIAAVIINDEATLKRVYVNGNKLVLNAENPAYPPMVYELDRLDYVRIIGRAVAFQSLIK